MNETNVIALKGAAGTAFSAVGLTVSMVAKIEAGLRITSLIVGIAVGVATFISIIRHNRKKD